MPLPLFDAPPAPLWPGSEPFPESVQLDAGGVELCVDHDEGGELKPQVIFTVEDIKAASGQPD